jgi:hypothetical protein
MRAALAAQPTDRLAVWEMAGVADEHKAAVAAMPGLRASAEYRRDHHPVEPRERRYIRTIQGDDVVAERIDGLLKVPELRALDL